MLTIERLRHRHEGGVGGIQPVDQFGKVGERVEVLIQSVAGQSGELTRDKAVSLWIGGAKLIRPLWRGDDAKGCIEKRTTDWFY